MRSDFAQDPKTRFGMSEHQWVAGSRIPFTANKGLTSDGAGDAAELQCRLGAKDQERSLCWLVLNTQIDE